MLRTTMMNFARRMRGALGMAVIWGGAFALTAVVVTTTWLFGGLFRGVVDRPIALDTLLRTLAGVVLRWSMIGGVTGLAFAGTIMHFERKRIFSDLSPRRFTLWGFSVGAIMPILATAAALAAGRGSATTNWKVGLIVAGISGAIGATVAALSLRAARLAASPVVR